MTTSPTARPLLIARRSSHLSRVVRMVASECGVETDFRPVFDLTSDDPQDYGGNPALKVPVLHLGGDAWFGALNICRALHALAGKPPGALWPEDLTDPLCSNALETVVNGMHSEVPIVMHRIATAKQREPLPEPPTLRKTRASLRGCVDWLEQHLPAVLEALPTASAPCFLRISLFCFLGHLQWREVMPLHGYPRLRAFHAAYAERPSARATGYAFERPPAG